MKKLIFTLSGASTGTMTTIALNQTANRILTIPDISDTIVTLLASQTLSNKILTIPTISQIFNSSLILFF